MDIFQVVVLLFIVAIVASVAGYAFSLRSLNKKNTVESLNNTTNKISVIKKQPAPDKLILGDEHNTWGEIARYTPSNFDSFIDLNFTPEIKSGLNSIFQHAPSLATNVATASSNIFTLTASSELQKGLAKGSLAWMKALNIEGGIRGTVVSKSTNLIQGQGVLLQASTLQSLNVVAAVWQVMAMITAQKFLSDINKHLGQINSQLQKLNSYLEQKDHSEQMGILKYLTEIKDTITLQRLDRDELLVYLNQIEMIEQKTSQQFFFYSLRIKEILVDFKDQPLNKGFITFGDDGKIDKVKNF